MAKMLAKTMRVQVLSGRWSMAILSILILGPAIAAPQLTPQSQAQTSANKASQVLAAKKESERARELLASGEGYSQYIKALQASLDLWKLSGDLQSTQGMRVALGAAHFTRGDLRSARKIVAEGLEATSISESSLAYRPALLQLSAMIAREEGDPKTAIKYYQELISNQGKQSTSKPSIIASHHLSIASAYDDLGDFQASRQAISEARRLLTTGQDDGELTSAWLRLLFQEGIQLFSQGELIKAAAIAKEAKAKLGSSPTQEDLEVFSSIRLFLSGSILPSACQQEAKTLQQIITATQSQEKSEPSQTTPKQGYGFASLVESSRKREDWKAEAQALSLEAGSSKIYGGYKQAQILYERELSLRRKMGDTPGEARTLADIAAIAIEQGQSQAALQALQESLSIQRKLGMRPAQLQSLMKISDLYETLGAGSLSLGFSQQALALAAELPMPGEQITSLMRVASLQKEMHGIPLATESLAKAMTIAKQTGECWMSTLISIRMAQLELDAGNLPVATQHIDNAAHQADGLQDEERRIVGQAKSGEIKARILLRAGRAKPALEEAQRAWLLLQQTKMSFSIRPRLLTTIAEAHVALGQIPQAISAYQQQLDILATLNLAPGRAQALYSIAQLQRRTGDLPAALTTINEAITVVESIRKQVADPELRTSYFASKQDFYSFKVDLLLELEKSEPGAGHAAEAFHTSERSRARTLLELLQEARADIRQGVDPVLLEQEKALQYRRTALDKRWKQAFSEAGASSQLPQLQQERQQLMQEAELLRQKMRSSSPRYASLTDPKPLTLAQVQKQLLEPDTLLLQYALGPERSHLFVVSQASLQVYTLPPASKIETMVQALREPLTRNQSPEIIKARASDLSQLILKPVTAIIDAHKRLILVPDGALHLVPFASLPLDGEPLGNKQQLLHLPSSSTLSILREKRTTSAANRTPSIAVLADPIFSANDGRMEVIAARSQPPRRKKDNMSTAVDVAQITSLRANESLRNCDNDPYYCRLKYTRDEAKEIRIAFPPGQAFVALDTEANHQLATAEVMHQYSHLHFATHGIYNIKEPSLSGLLLARVDQQGKPQDGLLQLGDIFNLKLNADLVVLSACETGLGTEIKGEGLVGLARGFLYAGSQRVVVSLWKVDDAATASFMSSFYNAMLQQKLSPSQALRSAQLQMRSQTAWASPFYWGAFALHGEW